MTRVLVSRQPSPTGQHRHAPDDGLAADHGSATNPDACGERGSVAAHDLAPSAGGRTNDPATGEPRLVEGIQERLRAAMALLPPVLGGASRQPLDLGRTTRVVHPSQRAALAVRDGGCIFPGCDRPLAWCEAHHLWHWLDGGPTDLSNLALVCRRHHRVVHEEGWQLTRGPDGRFTAAPTRRRHSAVD